MEVKGCLCFFSSSGFDDKIPLEVENDEGITLYDLKQIVNYK